MTLYDIWMGAYNNPLVHPRWIPIVPVDSQPLNEPTLNAASQAYKVVAMSKFGYNELKRAGLDAHYIPHMVRTDSFFPIPERKTLKAWLHTHSSPIVPQVPTVEMDENTFVIGKNCANKDPYRKGTDRELLAYQML